eukprot:scaffold177066_cov32-Tisochrysis_lutea.AAC.6
MGALETQRRRGEFLRADSAGSFAGSPTVCEDGDPIADRSPFVADDAGLVGCVKRVRGLGCRAGAAIEDVPYPVEAA